MKRTVGGILVSSFVLGLLGGCAARPAAQVVVPQAPASSAALAVWREKASRPPGSHALSPVFLATTPDEPVARLPGLVITQKQFLRPLIEGHGLTVLLNVVQLELARQNAQRRGLGLSADDLSRERDRTLEQAFGEADNKTAEQIQAAQAKGDQATVERLKQELKKDRERALDQLLVQQRVSLPEFELVLQTNAYLRKIAEQDMKEISDDLVRKAFESEYGATVRVRHIQATSRQDLATTQERLKAGEAFDKVAREVSRNPRTAPLGGELPRFSLATTNVPANFKQVAFGLNEGEVSGIVECDGVYHLIKLEQKFAPRAVKYESVRDGLRAKVREQVLAGAVSHLRDQMAEQARTTLKIEDPVLRDQFARRLQERDRQLTDMKKIQEQQARERQLRQEQQQQQPGAQPEAGVLPAAPVDPQKILRVPPSAPAPAPGAAPPAQNPPK